MIDPLPYSFSIVETASSIALALVFLASSMTIVLGLAVRACRSRLASKSHTASLFSFQLLALAGPGTAGCDGESSKTTPVDRSAESPASIVGLPHVTGIDAGDLEGREDPPAPAGDLKAEIEHFTTVDACIDQRSHLDPVLGDAIEAIGYDTFLRDACRVIDAAKANDEARCGDIDSSPLAAHCRATVAEVAASPEKCPWEIADRPARGRVPACIAV